jgi:hypothetical protein
MTLTKEMHNWLGRIDVEDAVLDVLAEPYPEDALRETMLGDLTPKEAIKQWGHPSLDEWLERQYNGPLSQQVRNTGKPKNRSVVKHVQVKSAAPPQRLYRIRIETWPKKRTQVSMAPLPHGVDAHSLN